MVIHYIFLLNIYIYIYKIYFVCFFIQIYPSMDNLTNNKISRRMVRSKLFFVSAVILQLAPVLHYYDTLKYALKTRKCEKSGDRVGARRNREKMAREDQDVALLRVFECFLEAAPQQILQLTIILKHHNEINLQCKYITFIHFCSNFISYREIGEDTYILRYNNI